MEKNKKTNVKKTTTHNANNNNKKVNNNKNKQIKKVQPKKEVKAAAPKKAPAKVASKKATPKKTAPKQVPKKAAKKISEKLNDAVNIKTYKAKEIKKENVKPTPMPTPEPIKMENPADKLEKTMIFDGRQRKNLEEVVNKLEEDKVVLKDKVVKRKPINKIIIYVLVVLIVTTVLYSFIVVRKELKKASSLSVNVDNERLNPDDYNQVDPSTIPEGETIKDNPVEIKYSNLETITIDEFEAKVAEGEAMLVLISSETCSFSITAEPVYNKVLASEKKKMYRLDITLMNADETARLRDFYPFTATPTVIAVKDGSVVSEVEGKLKDEEFRSWVKNNS